MNLEDFLALPNVDSIEEEVFVSKRLGKFKVKAMTQEDFNNYQRRAKGKITKDGVDFDSVKFNLLMVVGQTIYPNFNDAELLKKSSCALGTEFVSKKLLPGEIAELARQIQKISGFDSDMKEDIEEAKN